MAGGIRGFGQSIFIFGFFYNGVPIGYLFKGRAHILRSRELSIRGGITMVCDPTIKGFFMLLPASSTAV